MKQCFTLTIGTGTVESLFSRSMRHIWTSFPLFRLPLAAAVQKHIDWQKGERWNEDLQNERLILGGKRFDLQFRNWLLSRFSDAGITPRIAVEAASPHKHSIWSHGAPELRWQVRGVQNTPQKESLSGCFLPSLCKQKRRLYFARKGIRL